MERIKRFVKENPAVPFILLFLVVFVYFAGVSLRYGDDDVYTRQLMETSPLEMALLFRQTWSGRLVIELISFTFLVLPHLVWQTLNSLVIVCLAHSFSRLCGTLGDRRMNWLACAVVCVYPMAEMVSAGWVVTSCNYLWPLALGVYALTPWVDKLAGRPVPRHSYILALPALVYAANADQMLAILIGFTLVFLAWMLHQKQKPGLFHILWLVVLAGMLVLYLTAPGPGVRLATEMEQFAAVFTDIHPVKRLYNVFMTASWYLLFNRGQAFILLALCPCLLAFGATKNLRARLLAALPLGLALACGPLLANVGALFPGLKNLVGYSAGADMQFKSATGAIFPFLLFAAAWGLLVYALLRWAPVAVRGPVLLVVAAGLCSALIMCVVPSAAISFQRYTLYLQMALLFAAFLVLGRLHSENKLATAPQLATGILAVGGIASLYLAW